MVRVRLLSMTVLLTALIWASADRLVNDSGVFAVGVVPVAAEPEQGTLVQPASPFETVEITVAGPRRALEALRTRGPLQIRVPVSGQTAGIQSVPLRTEAIRHEMAQGRSDFERLRVVSVKPDQLQVLVDRLTSRDVEIVANRLSLNYESEPKIQRPTVQLRVRESWASALPEDYRFQLEIGPEVERLLKERPFGKAQTVSVPLDVREYGPDAEANPRSVEVVATVRSERVLQQLSTVPVLVALSFANLERSFQAVSRDGTPLTLVTQTITVAGTPEAVGRLVRGETRAFGLIQIKEDDLIHLDVVKLVTPDYHLPKDVDLAFPPQPIEMKLVPATPLMEEGG